MESLLERFKLYFDHQSLMNRDDAGVVLQRISSFSGHFLHISNRAPIKSLDGKTPYEA
ncbi:unnamed protein product [Spirodela intermedia]|uniref:Uncharacterized protein n=1 Tax=Spirodela intermedia TaxID=51605 RepID=A0A7I8KA93_SPIIN|nr:unnamed protein product [Spirodela intermedia]